ncbi:MAG: hypothetical protein JSS27_09065 [Planctomycetes bacterium]|nr:hypothetical protein [Planctomycetota bacterium]
MPHRAATYFWADIIPLSCEYWRFLLHVTIASLPFIGLSLFALYFDAVTPFPLSLGITPYEVGGGVLGVLLVLRTNSGYDRWWEARRLWGGITNQSRALVSAGVAYAPAGAWREELARWVVLYAHAVRRNLRREHELPEAARLLGADVAAQAIPDVTQAPLWISTRIAELLQQTAARGELSTAAHLQMERERIGLVDHWGGCQRILQTPLPRAYAIVVRQFLFVFLATLPFGILQDVHWLAPLVTMFVAIPMLAIEEIGTELQNPFATKNINHLPLDDICTGLETSLLELATVKQSA